MEETKEKELSIYSPEMIKKAHIVFKAMLVDGETKTV